MKLNYKLMRWTVTIVICMSLLLTSCALPIPGFQSEFKTETVELTERQKSILADEGLSQNFVELSPAQKNSIVAIEDILCYLEDTYGEAFAYSAYRAASDTEPEYLQAYRVNDPEQRIILVKRKSGLRKYHYEDNYNSVMAAEAFQESVDRAVGRLLPSEQFWTIVDLYGLDKIDQTVLSSASSTSVTIMDDVFADNHERDRFFEQYGMSIYEEDIKLPATCLFYVLSHEIFEPCNDSNYLDFIDGQKYLKCYTCSISTNFDVYVDEK